MLSLAREKTSLSRVVSAVVFAFVLPPVAFVIMVAATGGPQTTPLQALQALPRLLMMSLIFGWVFVLPACVAWAVLHQLDRHYRLVAALVGLATGCAFTGFLSLMAGFVDDHAQTAELFLISAAVGALTGLGVWWIAYGRQGRLPRPVVTRPPLSL